MSISRRAERLADQIKAGWASVQPYNNPESKKCSSLYKKAWGHTLRASLTKDKKKSKRLMNDAHRLLSKARKCKKKAGFTRMNMESVNEALGEAVRILKG